MGCLWYNLPMRKGQIMSNEQKEKIRQSNLGKKHNIPDENKKHTFVKGVPSWNKGKKSSPEWREKLRRVRLGTTTSDKHKESRRVHWTGETNPRWKGGITSPERIRFLNCRRTARKHNAKGTHTSEEWEVLKRKYNYMCLCCKQQAPFITLSEDHIIPLSRGGSDYIDNIQPLCRSCNSRKNTKTINFFLNVSIVDKIS
ncbi:hypothetical protein LCGC14_2075770 [marine sediment metagenome]|uniref:HNH nuclease domain-containing protein n=1 Tax=marine sediment metagenome TaxID=412755 RepID=A0A0F9EGZ7_9ZZZZ